MANLQVMLSDILTHIACPPGSGSRTKTLSCLNSFVKFLSSTKAPRQWRKSVHGFTFPEIILCVRVALVHEATVIRVAALRALRYLVNCEQELQTCIQLGIPHLVVRSLDIVLNNSGERLQAIRFCWKMLAFESGAALFPVPIIRALLAIAFDGIHDHDKIHHAALGICCQLVVSAPAVLVRCGGVRVLLQNLLVHTSALMSEAVLSGLLQLLNKPETRATADLCLLPLVAPFTDHHYRLGGGHHRHGSGRGHRAQSEDREAGYASSKLSIGIILRSWNGITHLCQERNGAGKSELDALIASLYIEHLEVRRTILDLICDLVGLRFPAWTDEMSVALAHAGAGAGGHGDTHSALPSAWSLHAGFVAEEALATLPHLASVTPNMRTNHMALLVYAFVTKGLLDALAEVIVTSDTFISVRATMLLGEFLGLVDRLLPIECYDPLRCIPTLMQYSMYPDGTSSGAGIYRPPRGPLAGGETNLQLKQHRALEALTVLSAVRRASRARTGAPTHNYAYSPFLQAQVTFSGYAAPRGTARADDFTDRLGELQLNRLLGRDIEAAPAKLLKECGVLASKDPMAWQWETVCTLFRWCPAGMRRVEDSNWRLFFRRLVDFYKPSSNLFGRLAVSADRARLYIRVGVDLVEFLAEHVQNFCGTLLLDEFLFDIAAQVDDVVTHVLNPYEAHWNPSRLESSLSQAYFLLIGALTRSPRSVKCLEKCELLSRLLRIVSNPELRSDHYAKLIISSLNYADEFCRRILGAALVSAHEPVREYATKFLRVLVRLKPPEFSKWGLEFIIGRLRDESPVISRQALAVLEEAVHDKMFLESLIALRPTPALAHLGDRGRLVQVTFLSLPSGLKEPAAGSLRAEMEAWKAHFNQRYVEIVEVALRDSLSYLRRGPDGRYPKRMSMHDDDGAPGSGGSGRGPQDVFVPSHLYGQLAQHKAGLELLLEVGQIPLLCKVVKARRCETDAEIRELKAALWALAHVATSVDAFPIVEEAGILGAMVRLARNCPVLSVRHCVFHALCLVSSTGAGAEALRRHGWHAMPRTHHDPYPLWRYEEVGKSPTVGTAPGGAEMVELELELDAMSLGKGSLYSGREDSESVCVVEGAAGDTSFGSIEAPASCPGGALRQVDSFVLEEEPDDLMELDEDGEADTSKRHTLSEGAGVVNSNAGTSAGAMRRNSAATSINTTRSLNMEGIPEGSTSGGLGVGVGSPSYVSRSIIRRPVIRMPVLSDPDLYPPHPSPQGRLSLRELKIGSLDRHSFISPAELFSESKLVRANTSMTSLSTPSFRTGRQEDINARGPCYMGLCLPATLDMIFKVDDPDPTEEDKIAEEEADDPLQDLHVPEQCLACLSTPTGILSPPPPPEEYADTDDEPPDAAELIEALTTPQGPTASVVIGKASVTIVSAPGSGLTKIKRGRVRLEILRLVSNLISCVGAKANEQALLRLKAQFPSAFQNMCTYGEVCSLMSRYNMRAALRRFIQELFFDISYAHFAAVADAVVSSTEGSACAGLSMAIEEAPDPSPQAPQRPWLQKSISEEAQVDGESMDSLEAMLSGETGGARNPDFIDLK